VLLISGGGSGGGRNKPKDHMDSLEKLMHKRCECWFVYSSLKEVIYSLEFNGDEYVGYGETRIEACEMAAEKALRGHWNKVEEAL